MQERNQFNGYARLIRIMCLRVGMFSPSALVTNRHQCLFVFSMPSDFTHLFLFELPVLPSCVVSTQSMQFSGPLFALLKSTPVAHKVANSISIISVKGAFATKCPSADEVRGCGRGPRSGVCGSNRVWYTQPCNAKLAACSYKSMDNYQRLISQFTLKSRRINVRFRVC